MSLMNIYIGMPNSPRFRETVINQSKVGVCVARKTSLNFQKMRVGSEWQGYVPNVQ